MEVALRPDCVLLGIPLTEPYGGAKTRQNLRALLVAARIDAGADETVASFGGCLNHGGPLMRKSLGLLVVLASAGLATDAISQPATSQPLPAGLQRGPDAFVMLAGGAKGNVSPQRAGTAVVVKPYRPTVDNPRQQPCTVHCGPPRNVEDHRYKPEIRDHRTAVVKKYRPTVPNPSFYCNNNPRCAPTYVPKAEVRDHRHK
jgi:hypothetical protein